nr:trypsin alpha-like [Drosophila bipectinata]
MFVKTLLLLMAANVLSAGHIGHPENRIIGGSNAAIETAPWQVFLQKRILFSPTSECGGSLIRPDIVLTAGHCVSSNSILTKYTVRVGSSNKNKGGQLFTVAKIVVHEYFHIDEKKNLFLNDIAVLRLSNPVQIGPSVQTISLATYAPPAGAQALATGWGKISPFVEESPIVLQGINVSILSSVECNKFPWVNEGNICAGSYGKTPCDGDSGGGLVVNNQVVGVVSAGGEWCNTPTSHASVPYYHQWILGAIDKAYSLL